MTGRSRFLAALSCDTVDRPPIWLMRQAGRVLPEYRKLREQHSFLDLVRTPELCTEVTLQPIHHFGFDAAIVFSDILVIPEALGQSYNYTQEAGISLSFKVTPENWETTLDWNFPLDSLVYVRQALTLAREQLGNTAALLGFAGSPWTLACFMIEGGSVRSQKKLAALDWYLTNPISYDRFMTHLAEKVADYLLMQWESKPDAVQIFDSLSDRIPPEHYWKVSGKYIAQILERLGPQRRVLVFCKGSVWTHFITTPAHGVSVDWNQSLSNVKKAMGLTRCVQGNINPEILTRTPEETYRVTRERLEEMQDQRGYIVNLGHGLLPDSKLECIEEMIRAVHHIQTR